MMHQHTMKQPHISETSRRKSAWKESTFKQSTAINGIHNSFHVKKNKQKKKTMKPYYKSSVVTILLCKGEEISLKYVNFTLNLKKQYIKWCLQYQTATDRYDQLYGVNGIVLKQLTWNCIVGSKYSVTYPPPPVLPVLFICSIYISHAFQIFCYTCIQENVNCPLKPQLSKISFYESWLSKSSHLTNA